MIIGPFINGGAIILGAVGGALIAHRMPERLRTGMPLAFGVSSMAMGVVLIAGVAHMPVMVIATVLGTFFGELVRIEGGLALAGGLVKKLVEKGAKTPRGISHEAFIDSFVAILVLFCASGAGIFGALNEGMTHDPSVLIAKAFLDLPTAAIFATTLGLSVAVIAIPQMAIQLALAFGATLLMPLTTPAMVADFSATGVMMLATGLRICGIKTFPIGNMLPGLLIAMPVSAVWTMAF
ncbi:MAG: rane protein [Proteobacteria bacterium]|nr:rane protein [Pseudomonadota bacterium]